MTEQSEHLSNAQIENYGIRTSGAGPEAAQRDEHQRVNHQSIDGQIANDQRVIDQTVSDQRVEAHLADCAPCRNRLLGFHRSLFTGAAGPPEADPPENGPTEKNASPSGHSPSDQRSADAKLQRARPADSMLEGSRPTDSALADSKFANPNDPVDPQVRTAPTPECPSTEALRELAAGLTPGDLAPALTRHAATCDHCGPLLRAFTEDFSDDFSPEEQAVLNQLSSASPEWQQQTARVMLSKAANTNMAGSVSSSSTLAAGDNPAIDGKNIQLVVPVKKGWFVSWKWAAAAAAACALAVFGVLYSPFGILSSKRDTPEKVERLLAQGSTERRNLEMRIPYAAYSDFNQQRSGDSGSRLDSPASLNEASDSISKHLKNDPNDPKWLMLSARLDLLNWGYKPALSTLEKITDRQVVESPEFLMTRALALFEKSTTSKQSTGYNEAVDLLDKALQKDPDDPVLLFNQAIACEKIHSNKCAERDWNRLLAVEKDPQWIADARKHLDQIKEKKTFAH